MAQPLTFTPIEEPAPPAAGMTFTPIDAPTAPSAPGPKSGFTQGYEKYFRDPAMNALRGAVGSILDTHVPPEMTGGQSTERTSARLAPVTQQMAETVVPQTPIQAGAMAGTAGAGVLGRGASGLTGALFRVLGGATGGEAGNYLAGGTPGRGALEGGGGAAVGEGIGAAGGKLARSLPGAKGSIAADDAAAYATEMGRQSPPLAGMQTVQDLKRLAGGEGRAKLGQAKEAAVQQIEGLLPSVPAAGLTGPTATNPGLVSVPSLSTGGAKMPLRQANDQLSEIGARAFSKNPLDRTFNGKDQRKLYGEVAAEISADLHAQNPQAGTLWDQTQDAYKSGTALLRPLQRENAYRISPKDTQFNTPVIQGLVQTPKNEALLRNRLGDADYEALVNVLTRGQGQGKDYLATGTGGSLDAIKSWARGNNTGFWGLPMALGRTMTPNIGSQYAGRQPMSLPPILQQALDAVMQRQAGQVGQ